MNIPEQNTEREKSQSNHNNNKNWKRTAAWWEGERRVKSGAWLITKCERSGRVTILEDDIGGWDGLEGVLPGHLYNLRAHNLIKVAHSLRVNRYFPIVLTHFLPLLSLLTVLPNSTNPTLSRSRQRLIKVDFSKLQVSWSCNPMSHAIFYRAEIIMSPLPFHRTTSISSMNPALAATATPPPPSPHPPLTWPSCIATHSPRCRHIPSGVTCLAISRAMIRRPPRWCDQDAQVSKIVQYAIYDLYNMIYNICGISKVHKVGRRRQQVLCKLRLEKYYVIYPSGTLANQLKEISQRVGSDIYTDRVFVFRFAKASKQKII